jgi:hypothetical protein
MENCHNKRIKKEARFYSAKIRVKSCFFFIYYNTVFTKLTIKGEIMQTLIIYKSYYNIKLRRQQKPMDATFLL